MQGAPAGRRARPLYYLLCYGTSQTCRGCKENEGAWPCHPCQGVWGSTHFLVPKGFLKTIQTRSRWAGGSDQRAFSPQSDRR